MKALSMTQPWASLVSVGAKTVETRDWFTTYRGPLAIHAAAGFPRKARLLCFSEPFYSALKAANLNANLRPEKILPLGAIVAVVDLVDVVLIQDFKSVLALLGHTGSPERLQAEMEFGDYRPGRFMWFFKNLRRLLAPVPAKGSLQLWETDLVSGFGQSPVEAAAPAIAALERFQQKVLGYRSGADPSR
jgi:hypothetical protein